MSYNFMILEVLMKVVHKGGETNSQNRSKIHDPSEDTKIDTWKN